MGPVGYCCQSVGQLTGSSCFFQQVKNVWTTSLGQARQVVLTQVDMSTLAKSVKPE